MAFQNEGSEWHTLSPSWVHQGLWLHRLHHPGDPSTPAPPPPKALCSPQCPLALYSSLSHKMVQAANTTLLDRRLAMYMEDSFIKHQGQEISVWLGSLIEAINLLSHRSLSPQDSPWFATAGLFQNRFQVWSILWNHSLTSAFSLPLEVILKKHLSCDASLSSPPQCHPEMNYISSFIMH